MLSTFKENQICTVIENAFVKKKWVSDLLLSRIVLIEKLQNSISKEGYRFSYLPLFIYFFTLAVICMISKRYN